MPSKPIFIESLNELLDFATKWSKGNEYVLYRGQRISSWPLYPSIVRIIRDDKNYKTKEVKKINNSIKDVEKRIFNEFKRLCHPDISISFINKKDSLELLSLAQHYELPTRLLDWTSNPLAALYFAIRNIQEESVKTDDLSCIWTLCFKEEDERYLNNQPKQIYEEVNNDIFEIERTYIFKPKIVTPTIHVQAGWFTLHHQDENNGFIKLDEDEKFSNEHDLTQILFKSSLANVLRDQLDILHINSSTLFPDIYGKASHIKWKTLKHFEYFDFLYDKN